MFVVDTNVLLDAANKDSLFHEPCRKLVDSWRRQAVPWFVTWSVCYEFLRASTHPRIFGPPWSALEAYGYVEALLASPSLSVLVATERHAAVLRATLSELPELRGNQMHDLHIAVLMREHGVSRIVTRDTDFHRFRFLSVIDPLR